LRKICECGRRKWAKCPHSWHFNYKPRHGRAYRFSIDSEVGKHIASKEEAKKLANGYRTQIDAGTFVRAADRRNHVTPAAAGVTLEAFAEIYIERQAKPSGKKTWSNDEYMLGQLRTFAMSDGSKLGDKLLTAITEDDLEAFHAFLRVAPARSKGGTVGRAASTRNQYVQLLKAAFRWAAKKGYIVRSPISEDSALKRTKIAQRARRLAPDVVDNEGKIARKGEERRLLEHASPRMRLLIIGALETGCRRGELLGLQWKDVDLKRRELRIRAENAKDGEDRVLPVSTRLAAELEMAKVDPAGQEYGPDAYPFGELGAKVASTKRAWAAVCTKAGVVDLHFHDLRHEAGSRLLEAGFQLHQVREMLGHANLSQTSTYLNAGRMGLQDAMRRLDAARCNPVANRTEQEPPTDSNGDETSSEQVTVN
jgi:integrase